MGAPTFTVNVRLTGTATQLVNAIQSAIGPANQLNAKVTALNQNLGNTASAAGAAKRGMAGFASSVGAFYLLNKASQLATTVMKEGFKGAADLQLAITELGVVSGASADQLGYLRNQALRLSSALGPIDVLDVVKGMTELGRIIGPGQQRIIADFTDKMAAFQNAMVLVSGGGITAQQSAQAAKTTLAAFGGFGEGGPDRLKYMSEVLDLLFKTSHRFSGGKLQEIMRAVNVVAPTMTGLGMSPLDIFSVAALRTIYPTGGMRASGADISAAVNSAMSVQAEIGKGSKTMRAAKRSAYLQLGMITPEGRPTIIDPKTGKPSLDRFFTSLTRSIENIRKTTPAADVAAKLTGLFETAFTRDIGKRFMSIFMQPGALAQFHTIQKLLAEGKSPEEVSKIMEAGLTGAMARFTSNWENVLKVAFMGPAGGLAAALDYVAELLNKLTQVMARSPVAASAGGAGAIGASVFGGLGALSTMFLGAGHALGTGVTSSSGLIARWIPAILTFLGRAGAVIAIGAGIASVIAFIILGSTYLYETDPRVNNAVNQAKETIKGILQKIVPKPEDIQAGRVTTDLPQTTTILPLLWWAAKKFFGYLFVDLPLKLLGQVYEWASGVPELYIYPIVNQMMVLFDQLWSSIKAHAELFLWSLNPLHWFDSAGYLAEQQRLGIAPPPGADIGTPTPMPAPRPGVGGMPQAFTGVNAGVSSTADLGRRLQPGTAVHKMAKEIFAPPSKPVTQSDLEEREKKFGQAAPLDKGEGRLSDLPPGSVKEGNSNAKVAATRSQIETHFAQMLDKIVTQQAGGMARTGTINRGAMPLRAR